MAGPMIVKNPRVVFNFGASGNVDVSAYVKSAEVGYSSEMADIGTFSAPSAQGVGRTVNTGKLTMLYEPTTWAMLSGYSNTSGTVVVYTTASAVTGYYKNTSMTYGVIPLGSVEAGSGVESELELALASDWQAF